MSLHAAPLVYSRSSHGESLLMNNSKLVPMRAHLRMHIDDWDRIAPRSQNDIARYVMADRLRTRDQVMTELGHDVAPPDDNPIPGGSPI